MELNEISNEPLRVLIKKLDDRVSALEQEVDSHRNDIKLFSQYIRELFKKSDQMNTIIQQQELDFESLKQQLSADMMRKTEEGWAPVNNYQDLLSDHDFTRSLYDVVSSMVRAELSNTRITFGGF